MDLVPFVVAICASVAMIACAACVFCWLKVSAAAKRVHSTSSLLAELHEMRDYCVKLDRWSKRINARLYRDERDAPAASAVPAATAASALPTDPIALKQHLRRIAGIVPGKPAPHSE